MNAKTAALQARAARQRGERCYDTFVGFDELALNIHAWAIGKGFWERRSIQVQGVSGDVLVLENPLIFASKRDLMHTEIAEMTEAERDEDRSHEEEELADLIIRALDYAAGKGFSMDHAIPAKMAKNETRPYKHGRRH